MPLLIHRIGHHDAKAARQKELTFFCESDRPGRPMKQSNPQILFQARYCLPHRRGRDAQGSPSGSETALLRRLDKGV
jgi:hypothetical protein